MPDEKLLSYLSGFISENRLNRIKSVAANRTYHFTVAIEDVYQLHNTSAVIRTCDVFGVQEVNVIEERNRKQIDREIAMGAQKWVDINRHHDSSSCIAAVRNKGYRIIAASPHEKDFDLGQIDISHKTCFLFGSEAEGLSDEVQEQADGFIKIPMYGFTESLNISVSAAIILQEATQRLRSSNINWKLSEEEQFQLYLKWIKKTLKSYEKIMSRYPE